MSLNTRLNRRSFIQALGLGAAAVNLPYWRIAQAQSGASGPLRCIFITTHNGFPAGRWEPTGGETDFELSSILAPLAPFRDKLLIVHGPDMGCALGSLGGGHQNGTGGMLTGHALMPGDICGGNNCNKRSGFAGGQSVDQFIASRIATDLAVPSLQLGVRVRGSNNRHVISYAAPEAPMFAENDPVAAFNRVFGNLNLSDGELEKIRRERRSVLDFLKGDLASVKNRLGAADSAKVQSHLDAVRDLESQLQNLGGGQTECAVPEAEAPFNVNTAANFPKVAQLQMDLLAAGMACDQIRVGTLMFGGGTNNQTYNFDGVGVTEGHHSLSHRGNSDVVAQDKLERINIWFAEQVAYFLGKLDAIPEGDGTVLDNTLVFWGNPLSVGNAHSRRNMKYVLAGGAGGYLRTGRYLRLSGRAHNDLLVSACHAMGLTDVNSYGDPEFCTGPMSELT